MSDVDDIKQALLAKRKKDKRLVLLDSGSTLLNLACSGRASGAWPMGKYILLVGDSASGKTFLSLTCLAEAAANPLFAKHRLIFDAPEDGALMDMRKFFGAKMQKRLIPPKGTQALPHYSHTIEEFYYNVDDALAHGPCIYVLDSMDALGSSAEEKKEAKNKAAFRSGRQETGSFGDGKAKINSTRLRRLINKLKKTGSILIIISQTRDNLSFGFETKTRAGGRALRFYATLEVWSSIAKSLSKRYKEKNIKVGTLTKLAVKKNRVTGTERSVEVPIYYSYGFDDIGSCIDYLLEWGDWKIKAGVISAPGFKLRLERQRMIRFIEDEQDHIDQLRQMVQEAWDKAEAAVVIKRKPRYQ